MTALKIKVKKAKMVRKIEGAKVTGFYGRVVSTGKKTFEEVAKESARNTTLHEAEATLAANLLLDGIRDRLKEGYIVDLGPLGTLYPSVTGPWKQDADELALTDMTPKATYQPSDEKASRAVVRTLQCLAQENNMHIVVVIDKKQERMQGHLGVALDKKATTITTCNFTEDKNLHFVDVKIRGNVCPIDEIVKL